MNPYLAIPLVFLGVLAIIALWAALTFNRLVKGRNQLRESWSGIDVQLKRRRNLVPNLVDCVKAYQKHEEQVLVDVVKHRQLSKAAGDVNDAVPAENQLADDFAKILMLSEAYPELRADANFRQLSDSLVEIEDNIQYARRYYNGSVRDLNNLVEQFPSRIIAKMAGFQQVSFFEVDDVRDRLPPNLKNAFQTKTDSEA